MTNLLLLKLYTRLYQHPACKYLFLLYFSFHCIVRKIIHIEFCFTYFVTHISTPNRIMCHRNGVYICICLCIWLSKNFCYIVSTLQNPYNDHNYSRIFFPSGSLANHLYNLSHQPPQLIHTSLSLQIRVSYDLRRNEKTNLSRSIE